MSAFSASEYSQTRFINFCPDRNGRDPGRQLDPTPMKAYDMLNSPDGWCQATPEEAAKGNKVYALDPRAVRWWALSVSERGIARLMKSDKQCCLMEWNDDEARRCEKL